MTEALSLIITEMRLLIPEKLAGYGMQQRMITLRTDDRLRVEDCRRPDVIEYTATEQLHSIILLINHN